LEVTLLLLQPHALDALLENMLLLMQRRALKNVSIACEVNIQLGLELQKKFRASRALRAPCHLL